MKKNKKALKMPMEKKEMMPGMPKHAMEGKEKSKADKKFDKVTARVKKKMAGK